MSWADAFTFLHDALMHPAVLLALGICLFVAGVITGLMLRDMSSLVEATPLFTSNSTITPPPAPRRVRALSADLKPSFDSRKCGDHPAHPAAPPAPRP
jgi:hypothetical protein